MHENDMDAGQVVRAAAMEIALLDAEIKELQERQAMLKSHFKDGNLYPPGKYDMGGVEVVVSTNRRISQKKAEQVLWKTTLEQISVPKVDTRKARAFLSDAELESIMDNYDHKIEVRVKQ